MTNKTKKTKKKKNCDEDCAITGGDNISKSQVLNVLPTGIHLYQIKKIGLSSMHLEYKFLTNKAYTRKNWYNFGNFYGKYTGWANKMLPLFESLLFPK